MRDSVISHDAFVTKDVAEFDGLIKAVSGYARAGTPFLPDTSPRRLEPVRFPERCVASSSTSVVAVPLGLRHARAHAEAGGRRARRHPERPVVQLTRAKRCARGSIGGRPVSISWCSCRGVPRRSRIQDPGVAWRERDAPFKKVATLEIFQQTFDTPGQQEFGENLSFNPWRCLPEHRPLGGINRARRQVYRALSSFRHDRNAAPHEEPALHDAIP